VATAQVQPEAERLFREAAQQAFQRLSNADVDFEIEDSIPTTGVPRINTKHVSMSVRRPNGVRVSLAMNGTTDTFVLSGNSISLFDGYKHDYGTRSGVLRPDTFLTAPYFSEMRQRVYNVTSAVVTGEETLQIDGASFRCTVLRVTSDIPASSTKPTNQVWIDQKTGLPLKWISSHDNLRSGHTTVTVTHLVSGDAAQSMNFALPPTTGFMENDDVFYDLLLALPTQRPDFLFQSPGGPPISLLTLAGAPALLSFGADDCIPCAADRVGFNSAAKALRETGGHAVRVLVGDPAKVPAVESPDYTAVYATPEQLDKLGVQILPSTMVVTPRGTIYRIEQGSMTEEKMLKLVDLAKQQKPLSGDPGFVMANFPGVVAPVPTYKVPPTLTSEAASLRMSGNVMLSVLVGKDGTVSKATVTRSLHPVLDPLALEAVQKWLFKPGTRDGQPVNVMLGVTVQFVGPHGK